MGFNQFFLRRSQITRMIATVTVACIAINGYASSSDQDIFKNLHHEHSRLYRTAPQWEQLKKDIHNDRMLQSWFDSLETEANDIAATAPAWPLDGHNSTMICRLTAA